MKELNWPQSSREPKITHKFHLINRHFSLSGSVRQRAGGAKGDGEGLRCEMLAVKAPGRLTHPKDHESIWLNARLCGRSLCILTRPVSAFHLRTLGLKRIKTKTDHQLQPKDKGHISIPGEAEHREEACKLLLADWWQHQQMIGGRKLAVLGVTLPAALLRRERSLS